jgi:hypothetical protein
MNVKHYSEDGEHDQASICLQSWYRKRVFVVWADVCKKLS